jgi:hypothetical protein
MGHERIDHAVERFERHRFALVAAARQHERIIGKAGAESRE